METFDALSTIGNELSDAQLEVSGGLLPIYPWICLLYPEYCGLWI